MTRFDPVATYGLSNPMGRAGVGLESGRRWTYAELNAAVDRLAAWLVGCGRARPASRRSWQLAAIYIWGAADMTSIEAMRIRAGGRSGEVTFRF